MKDRDLCSVIRQIAWSYLWIHVHINLSHWDILPDWVGFWLIVAAVPILAEKVPSALLLRPLAIGLTLWHGISWILTGMGHSLVELLGYAGAVTDTIVWIVTIYVQFQLLTNLAQLAAKDQCPTAPLLLRLRTICTVISTLFALQIPWDAHVTTRWIATVIAIIHLLTMLRTCLALFRLSDELKETKLFTNL